MQNSEFNENKDVDLSGETKKPKRIWLKVFIFLAILAVVSFKFVDYLHQAPNNFPTNEPLTISEGATLKAVAKNLKTNGYIRSELIFFVHFLLNHEPETIKASVYVFSEPQSVGQLANRLTEGSYSQGLIKFTHIEGESSEAVADTASELLQDFDRETFLSLTKPSEGKLFPETYFIPQDYTAEELASLLLETFDEKITPYNSQIEDHVLDLDEIINLASILEREANSIESMKIVSGILQNRLASNMPLQVDSSIEYILDKPLSELTPEDLKIDSPYNTYLNTGLPPTPIGNPGLDAIEAVLEPIDSDYVFYITGNDGKFYYAKTFDEHRQNIELHLR